ncbi:MAG: ABC transporter ATP-binding protein [Desulfobacterales bacterium]|nr:ABC transporter ATP-binding protein [Desulfobacterales bacterium]
MSFAIEAVKLKKQFKKTGYKNILSWRKPSVEALKGISLEVKKGEIFGILGPNGAGKTTLAKILSTLILPDSGTALINGFDLYRHPKEIKKFIGYTTSEERSFYWRLTGRQNLSFFAALYNLSNNQAKERINYLVDLLALKKEVDKPFMNYSTGFKQRLSIARSLLYNPQILLMDEPTRSLDPLSRLRLQKFVKQELSGEQKKTILLATHDLSEAEYLCDKLAILSQGKIVTIGKLGEIKEKLEGKKKFHLKLKVESDYVFKQLLKMNGVCEANIISYINELMTLEVTLSGEEFISSVLNRLVSERVSIFACTPKELSLNEVFEQVVN